MIELFQPACSALDQSVHVMDTDSVYHGHALEMAGVLLSRSHQSENQFAVLLTQA